MDLQSAFRRAGWDAIEVKALTERPEILRDLRKVLYGAAGITLHKQIVDCDAFPGEPQGWSVVSHERHGQYHFNPDKIEMVDGVRYLQAQGAAAPKIRELFEGMPCLNANVLTFLKSHKYLLVPDGWGFPINGQPPRIYFWGTIFRHKRFGKLGVKYMVKVDGQWDWEMQFIDDHHWNERDFAAVHMK